MTYIEETKDQLTRAIDREVPVRFSYLKIGSPVPQLRMMSVYELSSDSDTFLGFDHRRQELRRFNIGRIVGDIESADDDYVQPVEQS
jgi:predicted DNA-binding transcriptional regulator YafY